MGGKSVKDHATIVRLKIKGKMLQNEGNNLYYRTVTPIY